MKIRLLPALAAIAVAGAFPSAASAAKCPKLSAKPDKPAAVLDFNQNQPQGGALSGGKVKFPGHFYEATQNVVVKVKGNRYALEEGSVFKFSCYGTSRSDRKLKPALDLLTGEVAVRTSRSAPGGVITEEGLFDPRKDPTMKFTVTRTLTRESIELDDRMAWFAGSSGQPTGTTVISSAARGPIVGVTPYVGPRPGSCRYVHKAKLTTKGSYGHGSATYGS